MLGSKPSVPDTPSWIGAELSPHNITFTHMSRGTEEYHSIPQNNNTSGWNSK